MWHSLLTIKSIFIQIWSCFKATVMKSGFQGWCRDCRMETGAHHHDEEEQLSEAQELTSSQSTHLQTQDLFFSRWLKNVFLKSLFSLTMMINSDRWTHLSGRGFTAPGRPPRYSWSEATWKWCNTAAQLKPDPEHPCFKCLSELFSLKI